MESNCLIFPLTKDDFQTIIISDSNPFNTDLFLHRWWNAFECLAAFRMRSHKFIQFLMFVMLSREKQIIIKKILQCIIKIVNSLISTQKDGKNFRTKFNISARIFFKWSNIIEVLVKSV